MSYASRRLLGLVALLPLVAVACGGSSGDGGSAGTPTKPANGCPTSAGLGKNVSDHGTEPASGTAVSVTAGDFFFGPTCITQTPSGTVTLKVENTGRALHNVSIPDQGIDKDVAPGETVTVDVTTGASTVGYFCKYHKGSGMVGALLPGT